MIFARLFDNQFYFFWMIVELSSQLSMANLMLCPQSLQ